jgi:cell division protein FtsW
MIDGTETQSTDSLIHTAEHRRSDRFSVTRIGGQGLWFPVLALSAFGLLFVYSASSVYAGENFGDEYYFAKRHLISISVGICAALVGLTISIDFLIKWSRPIFFATVALIVLTLIPPFGYEVNGASRWLRWRGLSLQPAEWSKIACTLYAAKILSEHPRFPLKLLPIASLFPLLLMQPDFGTTAVICFALTVMLFVHGTPIRYFLWSLLAAVPLLVGLIFLAPYRMQRLVTFLDPFADPLGSGFQVIQSFLAIASGGWFGKGLGNSTQKLFFLPEAHTDFVVAVIGEEMGLAGITVLTALFALFFFAAITIVCSLTNRTHRLVATGLVALTAGNTIVNLGMVVGLLPTKGLPLPFVSAGGTAYIFSLFTIGLLGQCYNRSLRQREQTTEHGRMY